MPRFIASASASSPSAAVPATSTPASSPSRVASPSRTTRWSSATQALLLPLYFISGVFVTVTILPHWLADAGAIFPVRHLANALLIARNPHTTGLGFAVLDLLIVAAWGAAGLLIALRTFSWQPLGR